MLRPGWFFRYFNVPRRRVLGGCFCAFGPAVLSWIPEASAPWRPVDAARYEAVFESWSTDYGFGFDRPVSAGWNLRELEGLAASITYLEREQDRRILRAPAKSILAVVPPRLAAQRRNRFAAYGTAGPIWDSAREVFECASRGRAFELIPTCGKIVS